MKLLVLGGTLFVGRHVVEAALERGHGVTLFNRGRTNRELFPETEHLRGDREIDLSAVAGREWDAVVDSSGYVPSVVAASARTLADCAAHYTFVSSVSAYRDFGQVDIAEHHPLAELPEESEDVGTHYGALKAACEAAIEEHFGRRGLIVRPGVIVGRYDWTNRFGYWVRRVAAGGDVLVPGPADAPVQIIDARDLADWILDLAERSEGGTFNAVRRPVPLIDVLSEIRDVTQSDARFIEVDEAFLLQQEVEPWDEIPLWLATAADPAFAGMMAVGVSRAESAGLRHRPLAEAIREVLAWTEEPLSKDYGPAALSRALAPERERDLLSMWATLER
jgi:2'-hydroxyisoflavone reductase